MSSTAQTLDGALSARGLAVVGLLLDRVGGVGTLLTLATLLLAVSVLFSTAPALRSVKVDPAEAGE